ncbi:MAG TPA: 6-bladed beta-propeller [Longimicrobiales bacterium]|nr:6-bladed beta-propeller [Longimicrobiales bacterium]
MDAPARSIRDATFMSALLLVAGMMLATGSAAAQPVSKASFLAEGSFALPADGGGSLERPVAIAWAPSGEIHVADERGTVTVFDAGGRALRTYGVEGLEKIAGLAVDGAGRSYVLDPDKKTVLVFDEGGQVVHRIGAEGDEAGLLKEPLDVAVGPAGLVYVLDKGRKGVQIFSLDGTFLHDILLPAVVKEPRALGVGPSGRIYVAVKDVPGSLVQLPDLTAALSALDAPATGTGSLALRGGTLREPVAVIGMPTGTVVAADRESGVLWSADGTGATPVGSDDRLYGGKGSGRGSFRRLVDVALAGTDELLLLDRDDRKVERVRLVLEATRPAETPQDYPLQFQGVEPELGPGVLGSAPTGRGTVWYALADAEGRNLRVVEAELAERPGAFGNTIRVPAPARGTSAHTFGQTVERAGSVALNDTLLVVSEPRRNRFHVFDLRTDQPIGVFGDNYSDDRRLRSPRGVALFADGRIAVADHDNGRVAVFSADVATLLGTFPLPKAEGVAISPQGRVFAWDEEGIAAGEVPLGGGLISSLPPSMAGGGVAAMATDREGNLYLLRRGSGRVAVADSSLGRLVARVGSQKGLEKGDRLTVDVDGNIYATDSEGARSVVLRWGVDVPEVPSVKASWRPGATELAWEALAGSFITGYQVEGAVSEDGPWASVSAPRDAKVRVEGSERRWFRVAARTLTGAVGRFSPPAPGLHLAAGAAFAARDWEGARTLGLEALRTLEAGEVTADASVAPTLVWQGFVAAHEAGDYQGVLEWQKRLGSGPGAAQRFEHAFRLADTHRHLGDLPAATDEALRAIGLAAHAGSGASAGQLGALRRTVFDDATTLGRWSDVVAVGEELLKGGGASDLETVVRLARAHLKEGSPARAEELARSGLEAAGAEDQRRTFNSLAFIAATELGNVEAAKGYSAAVGDSVPASLYADFESALTRLKVADGDVAGARAELLAFLFREESDIRALGDPAVARTALLVYAGLIESGDPEGGRRMLDTLVVAIPPDLGDAREALVRQADSTAAVADTRVKLGEGFGFFRDALLRDALRFFQAADARTDLDVDQRLIVKEILAAVFHSLGRVEDADTAFRGVFQVDPEYVLTDHLAHVQETYGLVVFTPEMLDHFRTVGPIM